MNTGSFTRHRRTLGLILLVAAAFALGFFWRGSLTTAPSSTQSGLADAIGTQKTIWTCSMHPQVQLPEAGACPICGMDLVPLESNASDDGNSDRRLVMSDHAKKLAAIRTVAVVRQEAIAEVRLVGKVEYDQTLMSHITARVPGRLDRMFVDYVGIDIRKGDHMVDIYSPELLTAQSELLEALRTAESMRNSDLASMRETSEATVEAARERLRLWGLSLEQIRQIERRGEPTDHVTLFAPTSGIVVSKEVTEGMYVNTGTRLYSVADLSSVWVVLAAYESDMSWIRFGQDVTFSVEAFPGETFDGTISFIEPVLDAKTRTVKVRVNVANPELRLKPEMFVRATIQARLASGGKVMSPQLAGQWICPMHPEVVEEHSGSCRKCGMALVTTESLGYVAADQARLDLMVPATAVLRTGKRALVYLEIPDTDQPTFEGREVLLGPRAGREYVVLEGLQEGDRVVVNGNFKIDSALQIQARPSMMSPDGKSGAPAHSHGDMERHGASAPEAAAHPATAEPIAVPQPFLETLTTLYESYSQLQIALAADDLTDAKAAFVSIRKATGALPMQNLSNDAHLRWMEYAKDLENASQAGQQATSLDKARQAFRSTSNLTMSILRDFGHLGESPLYQFHCPMAFSNEGADWLQTSDSLRNPYFGSSMLHCGTLQAKFPPTAAAHDGHEDAADKGGR